MRVNNEAILHEDCSMTSIIRALNDHDIAYLKERQEALKDSGLSLGESYIEFFLTWLWIVSLSGSIFSLAWVIICRLVGILPNMSDWQDVPIVYRGVLMIFGLVTIYVVSFLVKDYRHRKQCLERLELELQHNEIEESTASVEAVKCLQEPEHLMKIYLLRLSDGRIRVRYDYDSADVQGVGKSPRSNFPISREMTMVHFKILDEFRYDFGPTKIRKPRAKELTLRPADWPEDETWLDISWDDADQIFSS